MNTLKKLALGCLIFIHPPTVAARREQSCTLSMVGLVYLTIAGIGTLFIDIAPNVPDVSTPANTSLAAHAPVHPQNLLKNKLAVVTKKLNHSKKHTIKKEVDSQQQNAVLTARKKSKMQRRLAQPACQKYQQARNSLGYEDCMQGYKEACKLLQEEPLVLPIPVSKDWHQGLRESMYHARTTDNATRARHVQNCNILRSAS